jgi:hypothetical protein
MKKSFLQIAMSLSLLMGITMLNATEELLEGEVVSQGTPWVNVRLPYSLSVKELAELYYGSSSEADAIVRANRSIRSSSATLGKNMVVRIPITSNFTDQPERLGWRQ